MLFINTKFSKKQHLAFPNYYYITLNGKPYSSDSKYRMLTREKANIILQELYNKEQGR